MADLAVTAANVAKFGTTAKTESGTAGTTITAGQAVYKDAADGKFKLADCNSATAAARDFYGIALNGAADDQPLAVQTEGDITIGGTVAIGTVYCLSGTPGAVRPVADNVSGDFVSVIGVAVTTTRIRMKPLASGVAIP